MKNHCVRLGPAPPLAEARVTQLATASFRDEFLIIMFLQIIKRRAQTTNRFCLKLQVFLMLPVSLLIHMQCQIQKLFEIRKAIWMSRLFPIASSWRLA